MEVSREVMTLGAFLGKCIRCGDRLGYQEEVPQNNAMLEKQKLARATQKYPPRNCKRRNEIHKQIAAACNIKLSKYYEGKKKANTSPDFKSISGASEGQMNRLI